MIMGSKFMDLAMPTVPTKWNKKLNVSYKPHETKKMALLSCNWTWYTRDTHSHIFKKYACRDSNSGLYFTLPKF